MFDLERVSVSAEPVTLAEAKLHLKIDHSDEDELITALITAAREFCEDYARISIPLQVWRLKLDSVDGIYYLPRPPIVAIQSITVDDTEVTDGFRLISERAVYFENPLTSTIPRGVMIEYQAGHANVPAVLRQAILMLLAYLYESRQGEPAEVKYNVQAVLAPNMPAGVAAILSRYRVHLI
ncbi:head-tail connector protein [Atrimonas thermophila]|uniref:head-tail connector protein n=1 Tax=Atrimonas thermophila TaxID=3064161 RepID=UPI00399D1408